MTLWENCVEIRDLRVAFQGAEVLHGITADFPRQGITVLLGRSGSGKTTLLRAVNGLNRCFEGWAASGTVKVLLGGTMREVEGDLMSDPSLLRRKAAMVFQSPNPLPLSLRKNLVLPLELAGWSGKEAAERMERCLRSCGLWEEVKGRLNESAAAFSGGQLQRMCLARALALEPEILLLDEPTASLDRRSSEMIEALLLELRNSLSLIMVSHSLSQAVKLGSRFFVMSRGEISHRLSREDLPVEAAEAAAFLEELL